MDPRLVFRFTLFFSLALVLQACSDAPAGSMRLAEIATPIPPYVATDQAAAFQARATRQASEGRMAELAAESTVVVLRMTASVATEAAFARQTEQAQSATATASHVAIQATNTAVAAALTQTALSVAGTATQAAVNSSGTATQSALSSASTATQLAYNTQGTSTAIALGVLQASATAEIERIAEQRRSEQQTLLFRTWAWRIALSLAFAVGLFLAWQSANWVLLRLFGVYRLVNRPVVITPNGKGGFNIFDISRSLYPGAAVKRDGQVLPAGGAKDEQLQAQAVARAQAAELMLATSSGSALHAEQRRAVLHQALNAGAGQPSQNIPQGDVVDAPVIVIQPDDPRIRPLLDEVEPKLLSGGAHL